MSPRLRRFILENHAYHTISTTLHRAPILADESAAEVVVDALQFVRKDKAFVLAYAVMPDHVHVLLVPKDPWTLSQVMQTIKGYASREINRGHERKGPLFQRSFYDRVIRDEAQLASTIQYIEGNPVSAGLVSSAGDYQFSSAWRGVETDLEAWLGG
jgi:REP element-mobilizing transposase RayT